jgi:hypothetical protein
MHRRTPGSLLIVAVPLLLGLVALASRPGSPGPSGTLAAPVWIGIAADTIVQTLLLLLLMAAVVATALNIWVMFPLPSGLPRRRPVSASLTAYLYFGAAICFLVLLWARLPRSPSAPSSSSGGLFRLGQTGVPPTAQGITWLAMLVAVGIVVGAGLLFLRWWRSAGGDGADADPARGRARSVSRDRLVIAIGESLDALRAEPDPRRAVIAAYARLEAELRAIGRPREPSEAPLEYVARILTDFRAGAASLRRLTDLFEWAKFSQHPVDRAMKEEAIDALQEVRAELVGAPIPVPG